MKKKAVGKAGAKAVGRLGEEYARDFLVAKGYFPVAANFTVRGGELDLVMRRGDELVFVEVKTRTSDTFGFGEESFTWKKRKRMDRAIREFFARERGAARGVANFRRDIIDLLLFKDGGIQSIDHFEDV